MRRLTTQQVSKFEDNGFLVAEGLFDPSELENVFSFEARRLEELKRDPDLSIHVEIGKDLHQRPYVTKIDGTRNVHQPLSALSEESRLTDAAADLLGEPVFLFKDKLIFKPPAACGIRPHQDMVFGYHRLVTRVVSCMIACDATDLENGCLEVLAGGHRQGFLVGAEEEPAEDCIAEADWLPVPLAVGDVLFFDGMLPHRSASNRSERPRRVFIVTYNPSSEGDCYAAYYAWRHEWVRKGFPTHFASSWNLSSKTGLA